MPENGKSDRNDAWQETPKGQRIPVPKRGDVFKVFEKAAKTPDPDAKRSDRRGPKK